MATSTAHKFDFDASRLRLTRLREWRGDNLAWSTFVAEEARRLVTTLQRTQSVVDELVGVNRDRDLNDAGKGRKTREIASRFLDDIRISAVSLRGRVAEALNWLPNLPAAPDVESAAAAIALDTELRNAFREMGGEAMVGPLVSGQHLELRKAIVRAPEFLSGLESKQYAAIKRAAIADYQNDLLEVVADASYLIKQLSAVVGNAFSTVCDAAGRSMDVPRVEMHSADVIKLDEMLREYRVGSINSKEWFEASQLAEAKTPEVAKQRIEAGNEARRKVLRAGGSHVAAEQAAIAAASAVPDSPDEREPGSEAA
jgi:hypothetical protein